MKVILRITFLSLILSSYSFAAENPDMRRGTAAVDEKYTDEIKTKEAALEKSEPSGRIYDQEDDQDRGYQQKVIERQEEREGEPALEESEGTIWENEKGRD